MKLRTLIVGLLLTGIPLAAGAQDRPTPSSDFLFGQPHGWFAVRGGWERMNAGGDLFRFFSDQLTVDRTDFQSPTYVFELGFSVKPRLSITGDIEYNTQTHGSEYRHFIDNFGAPINQSTSLEQTSLNIGVKYALVNPGRSISRLAYVPRSIVPYVGGGVGVIHYRLQQFGDFVDARTLNVFQDVFFSEDWSPSVNVMGGVDIRIWRSLYFSVEGRYVMSNGSLSSDFVGFNGIDLDGFRSSTGFHVVF